jgi:hypothetical protein
MHEAQIVRHGMTEAELLAAAHALTDGSPTSPTSPR